MVVKSLTIGIERTVNTNEDLIKFSVKAKVEPELFEPLSILYERSSNFCHSCIDKEISGLTRNFRFKPLYLTRDLHF